MYNLSIWQAACNKETDLHRPETPAPPRAPPTGAQRSLAALTSYLYDRTGGSIGSLRALLSDAAIAAILDGAEKVDRKLLDSIPTDHAAEEFRTRTPVKHDGAPTPLRRAE